MRTQSPKSSSTASHGTISSAEEIALFNEIKQSEKAKGRRYLMAKEELHKWKIRASELEQQLAVALQEMGKLKCGSPARQIPAGLVEPMHEEDLESIVSEDVLTPVITSQDVDQAKYIDSLERFARMKTDEARGLICSLVARREREILARRIDIQETELRGRMKAMEGENERLRRDLKEIKRSVRQFIVRHNETKGDRRTRELQELAKLRAEYERTDIAFYAFVLEQLAPAVDETHEIDEVSVREVVARAGAMLRRRC